MLSVEQLLTRFDPATGRIEGAPLIQRHLSDLAGCFADTGAYRAALDAEDALLYTVATYPPGTAAGDLHHGVGMLMPGKIGDEYYMTKGHLHAWREAAELYIGLSGEGVMLLEDEATGESRMAPLLANTTVYVPGRTAHRTMNTGRVPLTYIGVCPAAAGYDYGTIAARNFRCMVVERDGRPVMVERGRQG